MIIRRKVNARYTIVPNEPINDERLSFEALGLLAYLLSRPDDWSVNLEQLKGRGSVGREKMQQMMRQLIELGYAIRRRDRDAQTKQFGPWEYLIFDIPQAVGNEPTKPQTENPFVEPQTAKPATENPSLTKNSSNQIPYGEAKASQQVASLNALCWKEALEVLSKSLLPELQKRSLVGKWLKRAPDCSGKEKFRAILAAAKRAGTGDPIPYITAALDREMPLPPDPKSIDGPTWQRIAQAAIKCRSWASQWGPSPGKKGCLVPPELITDELLRAVQGVVGGVSPSQGCRTPLASASTVSPRRDSAAADWSATEVPR